MPLEDPVKKKVVQLQGHPVSKPTMNKNGDGTHTVPSPLVRIGSLLMWVACSVATVLFNKLVLSKFEFNFPVALTLFHCAANSTVMFVLFEGAQLLPSPYRQANAGHLVRCTAPIAALFAVSVILRNSAFMYLPVATIQLLSSSSPVIVYVLSCFARLDTFHPTLGAAVLAIAGGCAWATSGSVTALSGTSSRGLAFQACGLTVEAVRGLWLKKIMLQTGSAQSSLSLLYLVSPVALALLAMPAALTELAPAVTFITNHDAKFCTLLGVNVLMAVCLNLSSFFFIKSCAITTTSITALVKDSMIILGSYALHSQAAPLRVVSGYAVTLTGTVAYTVLQQRRAKRSTR